MGYSKTVFVGRYAKVTFKKDPGNVHFVINESAGDSDEDIVFATKGRVTVDEARRLAAFGLHAIFPEFMPGKKTTAYVMLPGYHRQDCDGDSWALPTTPSNFDHVEEVKALLFKLYGADDVTIHDGVIMEVF